MRQLLRYALHAFRGSSTTHGENVLPTFDNLVLSGVGLTLGANQLVLRV